MRLKRRILEAVMAALMLLSVTTNVNYILAKENKEVVTTSDKKVILIDPGHGGNDPGKVALYDSGEILEKDINLKIAMHTEEVLTKLGYEVHLTRTEDVCLAEGKNKDLSKRCKKAEEVDADLIISIHANSFTSSEVSGAQVFYYEKSEEGRRLATLIQDSLRTVDTDNVRVEKANNTYYMLKESACTAVIIECGFLSNKEEALLLNDEEYQKKLGAAIGNGVDEYLHHTPTDS